VEVFGEGGRFFGQFGASGSGRFSLTSPMGIALAPDDSIWVTDPGHYTVQKWTQERPNSEITTRLWVDGAETTGVRGVCKTSRCTIEPQWSVNSSALSPGSHTARVKTTDGLGRSTETTRSFQIARDTTKPTLVAGGELVNAPEGWVEQEAYGLNATATDGASGVTSISFKIDGQQVASVSQACADGGCQETLNKQISMATYSGGAHAAQIVATDGVGNTTTKSWTINVDPEGHISTREAEATLEAVGATSGAVTIGPPEEIQGIEGVQPGLGLKEETDAFHSTGSPVPLTIDPNPANGFELEVANGRSLAAPCESSSSEAEEPRVEVQGEGASETGASLAGEEPCLPLAQLEQERMKGETETITITPISVSPVAASSLVEGQAAVAPNVGTSHDLVTRPLADGGLTFADIRASEAPENYGFSLGLSPELALRQADSKRIEVFYKDYGFTAFTINAIEAHDAVGTTVPTRLTVTGPNTVALTVEHRSASPAGGSFVYPVIGGAGWQGGYRTISVNLDEPEPEPEAAGEASSPGEELYVSPPEAATPEQAGITDSAMLRLARNNTTRHHVHFIRCGVFPVYWTGRPNTYYGEFDFNCGNPFTREEGSADSAYSFGVRARFYVSPGNFVKHRGAPGDEIECSKMSYPDHYEGKLTEPEMWINPAQRCVVGTYRERRR
jgi:hypothetical protein